jgi:hypothetical protein
MSFVKVVTIILLICAACGQSVACGERVAKISEEEIKSIDSTIALLGGGPQSYQIGLYDLDSDGELEAVVLIMTGDDWCGTGGCTLFVLKKNAGSWSVISKTPASRAPVEVLGGKTNGWFDLAVTAQGGGDLARKRVSLKFQHNDNDNGYVKSPEVVKGVRQVIIP